MNRKRMQKRFLFVNLSLAAIFLISLLNIVLPDRKYSENENRALAGRPEFTLKALASGAYFKDFDSYYADQFLARDNFIKVRTFGRRLTGAKEIGGVYLGRNGYLLGKPETPDAEAEKTTAKAMNDFARRHNGVAMRALIIPDAANILKKKVPQNAPVRDQISDIRQFEKGLRGITCVDGITPLQKNSDKALFYKTDHHWTTQGALTVFQGTAKALGISKPEKTYKKYLVSNSFYGTLASKTGCFDWADEIEVAVPKKSPVSYVVYYPDTKKKSPSMFMSSELKKKDQYLVFFGGNHALVDIRTTGDASKTLLVFKDSYANSFIPFLYPYYGHIIMIDPRYYYDNVETLMKSSGVTDVLFLYSADTLVKDTNLADVLNAGK